MGGEVKKENRKVKKEVRNKNRREIQDTNRGKRRNKGISAYYTNCRSVRNKIDLLRGIACVEKPDVIAITETWISTKDKQFLTEFKIEGYCVYHKDRIGREGGG